MNVHLVIFYSTCKTFFKDVNKTRITVFFLKNTLSVFLQTIWWGDCVIKKEIFCMW